MAKAGLHIMQQCQPLLHIAQRQPMAFGALPGGHRIADFEHDGRATVTKGDRTQVWNAVDEVRRIIDDIVIESLATA